MLVVVVILLLACPLCVRAIPYKRTNPNPIPINSTITSSSDLFTLQLYSAVELPKALVGLESIAYRGHAIFVSGKNAPVYRLPFKRESTSEHLPFVADVTKASFLVNSLPAAQLATCYDNSSDKTSGSMRLWSILYKESNDSTHATVQITHPKSGALQPVLSPSIGNPAWLNAQMAPLRDGFMVLAAPLGEPTMSVVFLSNGSHFHVAGNVTGTIPEIRIENNGLIVSHDRQYFAIVSTLQLSRRGEGDYYYTAFHVDNPYDQHQLPWLVHFRFPTRNQFEESFSMALTADDKTLYVALVAPDTIYVVHNPFDSKKVEVSHVLVTFMQYRLFEYLPVNIVLNPRNNLLISTTWFTVKVFNVSETHRRRPLYLWNATVVDPKYVGLEKGTPSKMFFKPHVILDSVSFSNASIDTEGAVLWMPSDGGVMLWRIGRTARDLPQPYPIPSAVPSSGGFDALYFVLGAGAGVALASLLFYFCCSSKNNTQSDIDDQRKWSGYVQSDSPLLHDAA